MTSSSEQTSKAINEIAAAIGDVAQGAERQVRTTPTQPQAQLTELASEPRPPLTQTFDGPRSFESTPFILDDSCRHLILIAAGSAAEISPCQNR
jgi:hypothetical protein